MHRLRIAALLAVLLLAGATGASACTSGGVILGTRDSACFRVLPSARRDVGATARFAGVRRLAPQVLVDYLRRDHRVVGGVPAALGSTSRSAACLVAFRGQFSLASVRQGWAPLSGPYRAAIVILDESHNRLLATVLLRSGPTPLDFIHAYAFQR